LSELLAADITRFLDSPTRADYGFDHGRFERRVLTGELASLLNHLSGS
jgi:hypothetical protein